MFPGTKSPLLLCWQESSTVGLRMVTFAFSLKTIRTTLTGQSKALPLETQNTPPTRGQTQTGLAPRKVSSRVHPFIPPALGALQLLWGLGSLASCVLPNHTKMSLPQGLQKETARAEACNQSLSEPANSAVNHLVLFLLCHFQAITFTLQPRGEIF